MSGVLTIELQQILDAKGLTYTKLSEMTQIRPARIAQICKGFVDRLELDHIVKICDALEVPPSAWIIYTSEWMIL